MAKQKLHFKRSGALRFWSLIAILRPFFLIALIITGIGGLILEDKFMLNLFIKMIVVFIIMLVIFYLSAQKLKCPVCMNPIILSKNCAKNKNAKKLFGISYVYKVIVSCIFTNRFVCQYCGEKIRIGDT